MTVCVAAICSWQGGTIVVGAADRLVTYGDIEYEQPDPKIWQLASRTVVLYSGSTEHHQIIATRTLESMAGRTDLSVSILAEAYALQYRRLRRELAAAKHLEPLGLSVDDWLSPGVLNPELAPSLMDAMDAETLGSRAIIAGVDAGQARIYIITDPGRATPCIAGYAAIGNGSRHAEAYLIAEEYAVTETFPTAILAVYLSKKQADITPGVGPKTDLFWVANDGFRRLVESDEIYGAVLAVHKKIQDSETSIRNGSKAEIMAFVEETLAKQQAPQEQKSVDQLEPPREADGPREADEGAVSRGPEEGKPESA